MKKLLKILGCVLLFILLVVAAGFGWLTVREYKPAAVESAEAVLGAGAALPQGQELTVLTWNIGYGGLGKDSDFFMDGGKNVRAADKDTVERYLAGIRGTVYEDVRPDLLLLQEVDQDSHRTFGIDQRPGLTGASWAYALNYSCDFVPFPMPPIGKVHSGLLTDTSIYAMDSAERVSLPCPFSWPVRTANLKRCLLVSRLPVEGTDRELVLINLHLEAYDSGEGKIAQTRQLCQLMESEYKKGNYVIAGGDFNQLFPGSTQVYPITTAELWLPGTLEDGDLPEGFRYVTDTLSPTCRLLNQPYDPADTVNTQHYVIDGFILSPNVTLRSVETLGLGFANSDHNPVRMTVSLD